MKCLRAALLSLILVYTFLLGIDGLFNKSYVILLRKTDERNINQKQSFCAMVHIQKKIALSFAKCFIDVMLKDIQVIIQQSHLPDRLNEISKVIGDQGELSESLFATVYLMNDPPWDNHYSFDDLYPEPSDFSKIKRGIEFELYGFVERGTEILHDTKARCVSHNDDTITVQMDNGNRDNYVWKSSPLFLSGKVVAICDDFEVKSRNIFTGITFIFCRKTTNIIFEAVKNELKSPGCLSAVQGVGSSNAYKK